MAITLKFWEETQFKTAWVAVGNMVIEEGESRILFSKDINIIILIFIYVSK